MFEYIINLFFLALLSEIRTRGAAELYKHITIMLIEF